MGTTSYSFADRSVRAQSLGYFTKSTEEVFTQSKLRQIHESMDPKKIRLREARDSEVHPSTLPIYFCMDVTGSMRTVPHELIKNGLPKMISNIIQKGIESPAVLFSVVGDSTCDKAPFQIGQFESGDVEMDTWLERVYPEGGGGANAGESYMWPWYFASKHIVTDAWEKRGQKGILITFGDEPCLENVSRSEFKEVMDLDLPSTKSKDLLTAAQEKWHIFHIHLRSHRATPSHWKEWLGQNLIEVDDFNDVPDKVAEICHQYCNNCHSGSPSGENKREEEEIII